MDSGNLKAFIILGLFVKTSDFETPEFPALQTLNLLLGSSSVVAHVVVNTVVLVMKLPALRGDAPV